MTNAEKFKEVFGFEPNRQVHPCTLIPTDIRNEVVCGHKPRPRCKECPFNSNWWERDYLPCFKLKERSDYAEGNRETETGNAKPDDE